MNNVLDSNCCDLPICKAMDSPIADHKEQRPPTHWKADDLVKNNDKLHCSAFQRFLFFSQLPPTLLFIRPDPT